MRLVYVDRPGYGRSDHQDGRRLLGWADDVAAVADALRLDRFGVVGVSGGGSHALACAARLPDRILAAAVVSGVGPAQDDPAVAAALAPVRREQAELARGDPGAAWAEVLAEVESRVAEIAAEASLASDVEHPGIRSSIEASLRETAARGPAGPATDLRLNYLLSWGFDLADVTQPVSVWHAENDETVPIGVARAVAARMPNAVPRFTPAGGHLLLWTRARDILSELRDVLSSG